MNPQRAFRRYMGWCPGVSAAARFVPDNDMPNRKIVASLFIGALVLSFSFLFLQFLQVAYGSLSSPYDLYNEDPHILEMNEQFYLFVVSKIRPAYPSQAQVSVIKARVDLDGHILEKIEIPSKGLSTSGGSLSYFSALLSSDGSWYFAYEDLDPSEGLKVSWSGDGYTWNNSINIDENIGKYPEPGQIQPREEWVVFRWPSLTEMKDGRVFLSFIRSSNTAQTTYYSIGKDGRWIKPIQMPTPVSNFADPFCFTLKNGSVGVLAVEALPLSDASGFITLTIMKEDGSWSSPIRLFSNGGLAPASIKGRNPIIFYSPSRDGYLLAYEYHEQDLMNIAFTTNFKQWDRTVSFFNAVRPSITEFSNGTLIMAYETRPKPFGFINMTINQGNMEWTTPMALEKIALESEQKLKEAKANIWFSSIFGITFGILSTIIALNLFGKNHLDHNKIHTL
jgi:hypothetical protein